MENLTPARAVNSGERIMVTLNQLHRDTDFDRFAVCAAYAALECDWNVDGWVRERPSNQRRRESIGVQLHRLGYSDLSGGGFSTLLPDSAYDGYHDEHEAARESYVHALIAFGLAPQVDPGDDLGQYIRSVYAPGFVAQHFPQLVQ